MENNNSRRDFLKKSAALALGTIVTTSVAKALETTAITDKENNLTEEANYSLPALPYGYAALEPHIDKLTMEIHHSKHHQAYVTNLNKALALTEVRTATPSSTKVLKIEELCKNISKHPMSVRNNAGGHYNHSLFWTLMKPNGGGQPEGKLAEAITASFGSFDEFKKQFTDVAMKRFGSGWAWLVSNKGKLSTGSTANQDNPLMNTEDIEIKGTPVLALDVWEHAYYLKNQNRRADYITAWWNVVNWEMAEKLFETSI